MKGEHLFVDMASGNPDEGEQRPKGFVYQDIEPHPGIDIVCDLEQVDKELSPGQCRVIRISHALEHFPASHIVPILKMFHKLLETEGKLEIHVPNFKWHCALVLEDKDEEAINYAFGGQRDQYDFHKTGFTPAILVRRVTEAGFKIDDIQIEHSIHLLATKN